MYQKPVEEAFQSKLQRQISSLSLKLEIQVNLYWDHIWNPNDIN